MVVVPPLEDVVGRGSGALAVIKRAKGSSGMLEMKLHNEETRWTT